MKRKSKKEEIYELIDECFYTRWNNITFKNLYKDIITFSILIFGCLFYLPYCYVKFRREGHKVCHVFKDFWCKNCDYKKGNGMCQYIKGLPLEFEADVIFGRHLFLMNEKRVWRK